MNTVAGILMYLILAPLIAGLFSGLGALLSARFQGEGSPHILQSFRKLIGMYREPWPGTDFRQKVLSILYPVFILMGGMIFFAGGNLALSILLLLFAELTNIYRFQSSEQGAEPILIERSIAAFGNYACQLFLVAAGFYCFIASLINRGGFLVDDLASTGTAPAFHMPAMLIGFIWLLLQVSNSGFQLHNEGEEGHGKERALLITGCWYRTVVLYAVVFLFNYSGTALSVVISIAICFLVWLFGLLLERPHSRPLGPVEVSAVSVILQIASFINLLILLP